MEIKIYQIYYLPEQLAKLDPKFIPLDNTSNERPDLREWYVWNKYLIEHPINNNELIGFVSHKFFEKTGITGAELIRWIEDNPDNDVFICSPCILNESVFANGWEQGDMYHPGISEIGNSFLRKIGSEDPDVRSILLDRTVTTYANYVVGNTKFWDQFMEFSERLFTEAEKDPVFKDQVFGPGHSNYGPDPSLPMFTFLIERLLPTFLDSSGLRVKACDAPYINPQKKYAEVAGDIMVLSDLKMAINKYDSDELYNIWNYYRQRFLADHPGVLGLE